MAHSDYWTIGFINITKVINDCEIVIVAMFKRQSLSSSSTCYFFSLLRSKIAIVKRLLDTRWSARANATEVFLCGTITIKQILDGISNDMVRKVECRNLVYGLVSQMNKLETEKLTNWSHLIKSLTQDTFVMVCYTGKAT